MEIYDHLWRTWLRVNSADMYLTKFWEPPDTFSDARDTYSTKTYWYRLIVVLSLIDKYVA